LSERIKQNKTKLLPFGLKEKVDDNFRKEHRKGIQF